MIALHLMNTLLISNILIEDRMRIDHSDTDGLKESLRRLGTIQPIVVELISGPLFHHSHRLIAGGRRLAFLKDLGHIELFHGSTMDPLRPGYVFGTELAPDEKTEIELEENLRRKSMTWQERAIALANIHRLKTIRYGEQSLEWSQAATGELFGVSKSKISYAIRMAEELRKPESPLWKLETVNDALRWFMEREQNMGLQELARRQQEASRANMLELDLSPDELESPLGGIFNEIVKDAKEIARERYLSNPLNDPEGFESYYTNRLASMATANNKVYLSNRMFNTDCIAWMHDNPGVADHIITDPPYAIDMEMLDQTNQSMNNIDTIKDTHDVEENIELLEALFIAANIAMKPNGYFILWCDISQWQYLQSLAERYAFKPCRWPVTWVKTHTCKNLAAQYNFTKTTEIAMVCRKDNPTLMRTGSIGHIIAGHDDYKNLMDHPFVKPFACWEYLVEAVSLKGQTILDPFGGEMSGPLSFLRLERNYYTCELDSVHFNKGMEHIKNYYLSLNPNAVFI